MQPHKHAEVIKAWADGAEIEWRDRQSFSWCPLPATPLWSLDVEFRVKFVPHKWQKEMDAFAAGATIEYRFFRSWKSPHDYSVWEIIHCPSWLISPGHEYRIKPKSEVRYGEAKCLDYGHLRQFPDTIRTHWTREKGDHDNIKATFEDGVLTKLEILK